MSAAACPPAWSACASAFEIGLRGSVQPLQARHSLLCCMQEPHCALGLSAPVPTGVHKEWLMQAALERASFEFSTCRSLEVLHLQIYPQLVRVEECKERPGSFHAVMKDVVHNTRLRVLSLSAAVQACPAASLA